MVLSTTSPDEWKSRRARYRLNGIPNADEEALQDPDWDPVAAAVSGLFGGTTLPSRAVAAGADAFAQGLTNSSLPAWASWPAALATGLWAGRIGSKDIGRLQNEVGAVGKDIGDYVDVWHASPHKFDRFDSTKIGTGEGSQYRGYGLYFAENPNVSGITEVPLENYKWTPESTFWAGPDPRSNPFSFYDYKFQDRVARDKGLKYPDTGKVARIPKNDPRIAPHLANYDLLDEQVIHSLRHGTAEEQQAIRELDPELVEFWAQHKPSIYQVRLNAKPSDFLDLDAPLSQGVVDRLAPNVQEWIDRVADDAGYNSLVAVPENYNGWELYRSLMHPDVLEALPEEIGQSSFLRGPVPSPKQHVAAYLQSLGIPGNRFLDKFSRKAGGSGTRNYVMFPGNDDAIEILKRYGLALPVAGEVLDAANSDDRNTTRALGQGLTVR